MKRDVSNRLLAWKKSKGRKPLILRGARQVGKTYILKEFANLHFKNCLYVNFEFEKAARGIFERDLNPVRIIRDLQNTYKTSVEPEKTLIIFDEIQACPEALNSLKYFNENAPHYCIAAAGSLLGVRLGQVRGFPVGQVNFLDLHPLSFFEFLSACGRARLRDFLETSSMEELKASGIHQNAMDALTEYILVGGMPAVVAQHIKNPNDTESVRALQRELLAGYASDFAKYADPGEAKKILTIWDSIPAQLAKENQKFMFKVVREGARAREYESALQWLVGAGLIHKLEKVENAQIPLRAYLDRTIFKIYFFDIGLLGALTDISISLLADSPKLLGSFRGFLTENYVLQELVSNEKKVFAYWESAGIAEIDLVLDYNGHIYPLEIKAGTDKRKHGLRIFQERHKTPIVYRASAMPYLENDDVINYPLYLICRWPILPSPS